MKNQIVLGDSSEELKKINENSIELCIIDPPYGINKLNSSWDSKKIEASISESTREGCTVKKIPVGMKFDPKDAIRLREFLKPISREIFRILKPGSFCIVFSQPRSSHQVANAFEEVGFEIRDQLIWDFGAGQGKAQGMSNFIKKNKTLTDEQKQEILKKTEGLKTPQLTPTFETMWLCQKPKENTCLENYIKYGVGLVNFKEGHRKVKFEHKKPSKKERALCGNHPTVKPVSLIQDLIDVFSFESDVVLDCFLGSGTTAVACLRTGRSFVGIEKDEKYFNMAKQRIENEANKDQKEIAQTNTTRSSK